MGSHIGVIKVAAGRRGLSVAQYEANIANGLKWCTKCKQWKILSDFNRDNSRTDGISTRCRACNYIRQTIGPSKRERVQGRYQGLAWCRDCAKWLPTLEVTKSGRCRTHYNAYMRQRYATDEHYRVKWRRMVHDRRRRIEPIDMEDAQELLKEFEGKCAYCGQPMTTFDHIIPVSKNGHSRLTNLLPACTSCNSSKRDTDVFDWMERTGKGTERAIEKAIFVTYVL